MIDPIKTLHFSLFSDGSVRAAKMRAIILFIITCTASQVVGEEPGILPSLDLNYFMPCCEFGSRLDLDPGL